MSTVRLGDALGEAQQRVDPVDARVLLSHVTGRNAAYLVAHREALLSGAQAAAYRGLVERRVAGEPVAYLTGEREFYGRPFTVTPAVLIPRPETELLVDLALERIPKAGAARILDLGTGSGCVAIAVASERSHLRILATDQSLDALAVARRNAYVLAVGNVSFLHSDWYSALGDESFDVIVSNPPYVAAADPHLERGDLRFEPRAALAAGWDGLDCIRTIVSGGIEHLVSGGWLMVEHGHDQAHAVRALFATAGYGDVFSERDLAGIERVTGGRLTASDPSR
ncbi:MAG TPA: peptide chain release factor N(5)-glutamine methyltransferase [Burkholderiales bacterium]|nr:peptide chain release factor N(5)-glutamine methyltransferase [Burkholderiales bacterium]